MNVRVQIRRVSTLKTLLGEIRDPMTSFCGQEGPVFIAVCSEKLTRDPRSGNLYYPVREVECQVVTVSSQPHVVTKHGWLAEPAVVDGIEQWTADKKSRLYAPVPPEKFGEINPDLLEEIVERTSAVISRYDTC